MHHSQRKPDRDRGVNGVAASPHDLHSRVRRQVMHTHHNGMLGVNWAGGAPEDWRVGQEQKRHRQQNQ
jgi:hypothetical protein